MRKSETPSFFAIKDADSTQINNSFELRERLFDVSKETKKLNYILNFCKDSQLKGIIQTKCEEILKKCSFQISSEREALYKVRNLLFHRYRDLSPDQKSLLPELNNYFEKLIVNILINYKEM